MRIGEHRRSPSVHLKQGQRAQGQFTRDPFRQAALPLLASGSSETGPRERRDTPRAR